MNVTLSVVYDAPEFSLDLITSSKHYTISADSHQVMLKWLLAINLARGIRYDTNKKTTKIHHRASIVVPTGTSAALDATKWTKYEYTFNEPGPLMINVMGQINKDNDGNVVNNIVVVTSFESNDDGTPGRSEASGCIKLKDYITHCNGIDLGQFTFNDAMDTIANTGWPKTLAFLRDNAASLDSIKIEGWSTVYYPALNQRRRRYIDIRQDILSFRKPAPGGSASVDRDAYFVINQVVSIRAVHDKTMPSDLQYMLHLLCGPESFIDHVGEHDSHIGGSEVDEVILYFNRENWMLTWQAAIVSSSTAEVPIETHGMEVIDAAKGIDGASNKGELAIKSELTKKFAARTFALKDGTLSWVAPSKSKKRVSKPRSILIANSQTCTIKSIVAFEDILEQRTSGYVYQLEIKSTDALQPTITIGAKDSAVIEKWLAAITQVTEVAPEALRAAIKHISSSIEKCRPSYLDDAKPANQIDEEAVDEGTSSIGNSAEGGTQPVFEYTDDVPDLYGYLYKREDKLLSVGGSKNNYRKRWFVLRGFNLLCFKSPNLSTNNALALSNVDMRAAYEVREAVHVDEPENSIIIMTQSKIYYLVAEDEDEHSKWFDALSDLLEARTIVVKDSNDGNKAAVSRSEAIRNAIMFSGSLYMKTINRITGSVVWKMRYFMIASGSLTCYEEEKELFDDDKVPNYEISLMAISLIETSKDPKCTPGCGIDIHADYFLKAGDSNTMKVFTLDAKSPKLAKDWMDELCKAIGTLAMKRNPDAPGWISYVDADAVKQKEAARRANALKFGNSSVVAKVSADDAVEDETNRLSEGSERAKLEYGLVSSAAPAQRRQSALLSTGRGGMGRGDFLRGGATRRPSTMPVPAPDTTADQELSSQSAAMAQIAAAHNARNTQDLPLPPSTSTPSETGSVSQLVGNSINRRNSLHRGGRGFSTNRSTSNGEI